MTAPLFLRPVFVCLVVFLCHCAQGEDGYLGQSERRETSLIGILYDLKQNQKREPMVEDFQSLMGRFLRDGWKEETLNPFYRATRPLHTTQIVVPLMNADYAPRAFGVEDLVQPRRWVIHYKGQVRPPHPGTFRFVGLADDLLAVAVNEKTVLLAEHEGSKLKDHGWRFAPRDQAATRSGAAIAGDWFTVEADETIDLDILVGERPGGQFGACLMIEEEGIAYAKNAEGKNILPAFQLSDREVPGTEPNIRRASSGELWTAVQ